MCRCASCQDVPRGSKNTNIRYKIDVSRKQSVCSAKVTFPHIFQLKVINQIVGSFIQLSDIMNNGKLFSHMNAYTAHNCVLRALYSFSDLHFGAVKLQCEVTPRLILA